MEGQDIQPLLRNMETHKAEQIPTLPEETIEEILSRLPVKSLLKFRCVSKSWRCLIGSKRFIKTHLENSTRNISFAHHRIILNSAPPYRTHDRLQQCSLNWLLNEQLTGPVTFDDSIKNRWESVSLVGCCNGLICILLNRRYFVLWNPSTRMSKKLPDIDDKIKRGHGLVTKHGFGCDESSGDYKVFGIVSDFFTYQAIGKVYSLKTNSWKIVKERDGSPISVAGKFASGKLHWASFRSGSGWDIVSFDLNSEIYGMIEQPCYPEGFRFRLSLGVVGGCLCMLCDDRETHLDVWVMKHYGVKESWNKVATVPHLHRPQIDQLSTLFYIGSNGEIILTCGSTFIIYSSKDNVFQCSRIINSASFHEADIYIESLVSLVPDVKQEMQSRETVA